MTEMETEKSVKQYLVEAADAVETASNLIQAAAVRLGAAVAKVELGSENIDKSLEVVEGQPEIFDAIKELLDVLDTTESARRKATILEVAEKIRKFAEEEASSAKVHTVGFFRRVLSRVHPV